MALTNKDIYHLLKELNEYAPVIYYVLTDKQEKTKQAVSYGDLENLIYKENMEQVGLVFPKLISKLRLEDIEDATAIYQSHFTKKNCIEKLLEKYTDKHFHLQEIKDVALTEELADAMIKDATYKESFRLLYTDRILQYLEEHPKDEFFSTKETLTNYRNAYHKLIEENEKKLNTNISNYYISTITD